MDDDIATNVNFFFCNITSVIDHDLQTKYLLDIHLKLH